MKAIQYVGNTHIMDCMKMLKKVWDEKFSHDIIQSCWRKVDILPVTWNSDFDKKFGRASLSGKMKVLRKETCDELFQLMADVKILAN